MPPLPNHCGRQPSAPRSATAAAQPTAPWCCRVADPLRHFADGIGSLLNPIGSVADKVNVGLFRLKSLLGSLEDLYSAPEVTTQQRLRVRINDCLCLWDARPAPVTIHGRVAVCGLWPPAGVTTKARQLNRLRQLAEIQWNGNTGR